MPLISDLVTVHDERWCWPSYDNKVTYDTLRKEMDLKDHLMPHVHKKSVMVQAGGNCGLFLEPFVSEFEAIYTFEPDPVNFYCLTMNLPYPNVFKYQACLGNSRELVALNNYLNDQRVVENGAVHIDKFGASTLTPTMRIDDLNLMDCDLIQLDIEGYEGFALMGASNTIQKYHPVLCIEHNMHWEKRYNLDFSQIQITLEGMGYELKEVHVADHIFVWKS